MGTCCCNCGGTNPPGTWGGAGEPFPTPPIYIPGDGTRPPLWIWGGSNEPFPGYGLPGMPPRPWGGANAPFPTPPIWLPPNPDLPPVDPPEPPAGITGPVDAGYALPPNDGTNYFVAAPGIMLPTGPIGYLIMPLYPKVQHLPAPPGGS